jgi:hypothetical protein
MNEETKEYKLTVNVLFLKVGLSFICTYIDIHIHIYHIYITYI